MSCLYYIATAGVGGPLNRDEVAQRTIIAKSFARSHESYLVYSLGIIIKRHFLTALRRCGEPSTTEVSRNELSDLDFCFYRRGLWTTMIQTIRTIIIVHHIISSTTPY